MTLAPERHTKSSLKVDNHTQIFLQLCYVYLWQRYTILYNFYSCFFVDRCSLSIFVHNIVYIVSNTPHPLHPQGVWPPQQPRRDNLSTTAGTKVSANHLEADYIHQRMPIVTITACTSAFVGSLAITHWSYSVGVITFRGPAPPLNLNASVRDTL